MTDLKNLDHQAVLAGLRSALGRERMSFADFLNYLGEVDCRRLYADEGQPSLFAFGINVLALTDAEILARITAARLIRRFPIIYQRLESGELNLTALRLISAHLTEENAERLLAQVVKRSTREIEKIVAILASKKRTELRTANEVREEKSASPMQLLFCEEAATAAGQEPPVFCAKRDRTRYVAPEHVEIKFVASEKLLAKLERIKGLTITKNVGSRLEDVLDHVLESYLDRHDPARRVAKAKSRVSRQALPASQRQSRYIPQGIKDEVYKRDEGQCTFKGANGERCPARILLEYDHCCPVALGGNGASADNVRLLCRTHNRLAAERSFGTATVASAVASKAMQNLKRC